MGGRRAGRVALAALLLAASAACNSSGGERDTTAANTVRTEPAPTTTTNPYAVPAVIDEAYVNRVLAGLDAAVGDIVRLVIRTRTIPPEALARMKAVYAEPNRLQRSIDGFQRDIREQFQGYKMPAGNKTSQVLELISATRDCIFARIHRDYSAVSTNPVAARNPQWVGLQRLDPNRDPDGYNQTTWAFIYDGFPADPSSVPSNPCAS